MDIHDAANIFPLDEANIDPLAADIKKHGLREPIHTLQGKVIDGRRRTIACQKAGIEPEYIEIQTDDPVAYVLSLNLHRRHLNPSQLSMVAARAREFYDREAKERMREGGRKGGESKGKENLPSPSRENQARDQAGKAVGVSGRSVDYATKVLTHGTPELAKAVDDGRMAVSTAAILATDPPEVQHAEVNNPKRNRKYTSGNNRGGKPSAPRDRVDHEPEPGESRGVGVRHANEAINCLKRIPKNDGLRKRGFQIVTDWIRHNK